MSVNFIGSAVSIAKNEPNQDAYVMCANQGVFAVFDGVGGSWQGQDASYLAAEAFSEGCKELAPINERKIANIMKWLSDTITSVHASITLNKGGSQTTASVLVICNHPDEELTGVILNVGDSRIYGWNASDPAMIQLTRDDNPFPDQRIDLVESQDEMSASMGLAFRFRNVITRALGSSNLGELTPVAVFLEDIDGFLLTSDGVHDNLGFSKIFDTIINWANNPDGPSGAMLITELAKKESENLENFRRKKDDITAVFVQINQR